MTSNRLAFCIIVKGEHHYIEEWLEHHFQMGADRIFIFDNDEHSHREIIEPWIRSGQVTWLRWRPDSHKQTSAYECCLHGWGHEFDWIAFIDTDEFIMPGTGLKEYLAEQTDCPAIRLRWRLFGANGHIRRPTGKVLGNYPLSCQQVRFKFTAPYKNIVNTRFPPPERIYYSQEITLLPAKEDAPFWLNHYITKSWEDWNARLKRGQVSGGNPPGSFFDYNMEMESEKEKLLELTKPK